MNSEVLIDPIGQYQIFGKFQFEMFCENTTLNNQLSMDLTETLSSNVCLIREKSVVFTVTC